VRLHADQFAVADHAARQQRTGIHGDLRQQRRFHAFLQHVIRTRKRDQKGHGPGWPVIPAVAVESEDEAGQIDAERQNPEKRHDRDVLRKNVGRRDQQQRRASGKKNPEQAIAKTGNRHRYGYGCGGG
jgi:hypothetical protein